MMPSLQPVAYSVPPFEPEAAERSTKHARRPSHATRPTTIEGPATESDLRTRWHPNGNRRSDQDVTPKKPLACWISSRVLGVWEKNGNGWFPHGDGGSGKASPLGEVKTYLNRKIYTLPDIRVPE